MSRAARRLWKGLTPLWGRQIPYTMMKFGVPLICISALINHVIEALTCLQCLCMSGLPVHLEAVCPCEAALCCWYSWIHAGIYEHAAACKACAAC